MNPLDLVRIVGMGLAIVVFARYLKRHPKAFEPIYPRVWIRAARGMTRRQLAKKVGIGILFACLMVALLPKATMEVHERVAPVVDDPDVHPVTVIANVSPWLLLAIILVMAPLEELIFRGMLLKSMLRHGKLAALLVSSAAFAALHFINPGAAPMMFIIDVPAGLLLGVAYLHGGLLGSTIAHEGHNGIWFAVVMLGLV